MKELSVLVPSGHDPKCMLATSAGAASYW